MAVSLILLLIQDGIWRDCCESYPPPFTETAVISIQSGSGAHLYSNNEDPLRTVRGGSHSQRMPAGCVDYRVRGVTEMFLDVTESQKMSAVVSWEN